MHSCLCSLSRSMHQHLHTLRSRNASEVLQMNRLPARQAQFVEEYSISHNGAGAAVRAGYSRRSAKVTAARLLTKANIRTALAVREAENARALAVTRERVLAEVRVAISIAALNGDAMAMIAGWREVAKLCGYYAPNQHSTPPD